MSARRDHWIETPDKRMWRHKFNPMMAVAIEPVSKYDPDKAPNRKYRILHTHPTIVRRGLSSVIVQSPEYAETMESAREKAYVHLRHWNNENLWVFDKDFGRKD